MQELGQKICKSGVKLTFCIKSLLYICKFKPHFLRFILFFKPLNKNFILYKKINGSFIHCRLRFLLPVIYVSMSLPLRTSQYRFSSPSFRLERLLPTLRGKIRVYTTGDAWQHPALPAKTSLDIHFRFYIIAFLFHCFKKLCKGTAFF